ncbi:Hemolysin-type calcium-binding repeat protein (fragment) [Hyella patelloides LEGE 07179]|uniref:Hemolysin-type calcium-binding repeat protein n=2 Tax=Hyella TaxID=945733 RepID=A0A563VM47_9CYAN
MFSAIGGETMDGGSGIDTIDHTTFNGNYEFNMANGETNFGSESFINFEHAIMGNGNDEVTGNNSANYIFGNEGDDTLVGSAGRDTLAGGDDNDEIHSDGDGGFYFGNAGYDRLFSGIGGETMDGGSGIDTIDHTAFNGNYEFDMADGETNFTNESFINFEHAIMGNGNDEVTGNNSANYIFGNEGDDTIVGGAGRDTLAGGDDNDEIHSDGDGGFYFGNAGRDRMFSGIGGETMDGGSGIDTIDHTAYNGDYTFNMADGSTNWNSESFVNFEYAIMGNGNDEVIGTNRGNIINTGGGNDVIEAGKGNDLVDAGAGDDVLLGFANHNDVEIDWLTGGVGEDRFIVGNLHSNGYSNAGNSDYALVTDFEDGDIIKLDNHEYSFDSSPIGSVSGTGIFDDSGDLLALVAGVSSSDLTLNPQGYTVNVEYA